MKKKKELLQVDVQEQKDDELLQKVHLLSNENDALKVENESLCAKIKSLNKSIAGLKGYNTTLSNKNAELQNQLYQAEEIHETYVTEKDNVLKSKESEVSALKIEVKEREATIFCLKDDVSILQRRIDHYNNLPLLKRIFVSRI